MTVHTLHDLKTHRGVADVKYISLSVYYLNPFGHIEAVTFASHEPDNYLVDLMTCAIQLETFLNQNEERISRSAIYRCIKAFDFHRTVSFRLGGHFDDPIPTRTLRR